MEEVYRRPRRRATVEIRVSGADAHGWSRRRGEERIGLWRCSPVADELRDFRPSGGELPACGALPEA